MSSHGFYFVLFPGLSINGYLNSYESNNQCRYQLYQYPPPIQYTTIHILDESWGKILLMNKRCSCFILSYLCFPTKCCNKMYGNFLDWIKATLSICLPQHFLWDFRQKIKGENLQSSVLQTFGNFCEALRPNCNPE